MCFVKRKKVWSIVVQANSSNKSVSPWLEGCGRVYKKPSNTITLQGEFTQLVTGVDGVGGTGRVQIPLPWRLVLRVVPLLYDKRSLVLSYIIKHL